jgi:hypothetical protein
LYTGLTGVFHGRLDIRLDPIHHGTLQIRGREGIELINQNGIQFVGILFCFMTSS